MRFYDWFQIWMFVLYNLPVTTGQPQINCSQTVLACAGDDVIIPCRLDPPITTSSRAIEWTRPGLDPEYVHVHQDGRLVYQSQNPLFNYRTVLFVDQLINGNVSLKLLRVKTSDSGRYKCFIPSLWREAFVQVTVREEGDVCEDEFKVCRSCSPSIVISVVFAVVIISLIILMIWKCRGNKKGKKNKDDDRTETQHMHMMETWKSIELEKKLKCSEVSQRKEKEEFKKTLLKLEKELEKQKDHLISKQKEAESLAEEHDRKVRSVEEEVSETKGDSTEKKAQGYLKLREICKENRKKEFQHMQLTTDNLIKMTQDAVKTCMEMNKNEEIDTVI